MTMIFETEHHLWLDAICQNQNLGKNLFAEKTLLADQRQCMAEWMISIPSTNNQPNTGIWSSTIRACSYRYYLMKNNRVNDISTNNQPMWSLTVRASSCRHYLICVIKNNKDTGTGKLGKLCSGKRASRPKWKSENETENPNTSHIAIITEK